MQDERKTREELISELSEIRSHTPEIGESGDGRKRAASSRLSEWYELVAEKSYSGIYIFQDGGFKWVNQALADMAGYTRDELMSLGYLDLIHPDYRDIVRDLTGQALTGDTSNLAPELEVRFFRNGGEIRWARIMAALGTYNDRTAIIGNVIDITERKQAEEALRESEDKYRNLVERANDGICIIQDGLFQFVNGQLAHIWGGSPEGMIGTPFTQYLHPESVPQVNEYYRRRMAGEDVPSIYETVLQCKDGSTREVEINAGVIMYQARAANLAFVRDISARKRAEEKLEETKADLERSNKELEHFAYIVSHDLQEPLRMVSGYMKLIEKRYNDMLDDDGKEFIHYAADGSRRMQELLNDLLTYCRVSTRGKPLQPVDCNAVLRSVTVMLDMAIRDADAEVTWDDMPQVVADESQIVQLFQNLIANAIKYRQDETPRIHVSVEQRNSEWLFSVQDNGIGIDPQFKERVFLIFERLHRQEYEGTGIGLAVCKKIVERHGGQIWVESEPGGGTTFHFTIPTQVLHKGKRI
ncbi:MAG: sensor histidine kinase [Chloroflexota bacterium]